MALNNAQKEAINHKQGPMMVLAGPGSGKTMVITHRTKELVQKNNVDPSSVLVITFTKAAAEEMKSRFLKLTNEDNTKVTFGTFHAVFFRMLRSKERYRLGSIIDEEKKYRIIKEIVNELNIEYDDENEFIKDLILEISNIKNELIDIQNYNSKVVEVSSSFVEIYNQYETFKKQNKVLDFDDILVRCYNNLKENKSFLAYYQNIFKYILIDEFQDINKIQYECVKLLSQQNNNLFIVGDDDQSIYEFRGARPDFLLNFPKDYSEVKKVILDINYRSTKEIVKVSSKVIDNNKKRYKKNIRTVNEKGNSPNIIECKDVKDEAYLITNEIKKQYEQKIDLSEIAIIYRTNIQGRAFVEKLMDLNIPFFVRDQMANIYQHWVCRDILAYFMLSINIKDKDSLIRIINKPKRYISKQVIVNSCNNYNNPWEGLYDSLSDKSWMVDKLEEMQYHIQIIKKLSPAKGLEYIRKMIGYDNYIAEYSEYRKISKEGLYEILDEVQESIKQYETLDAWLTHIDEYTESLKKQMKNKKLSRDKERVTLTTMHSSKGLEFEWVYLVGANESIIPYGKSLNDDILEEERRLFYDGLTRAKKNLMITYVNERFGKETEPSRYLGEMIISKDELKKGDTIVHKVLGVGKVIKIKDDTLYCFFSNKNKSVKLNLKHCIKSQLIKKVDTESLR